MKGSGYSFIHAADMMYCADNHVRSKSDPEYVSGSSGLFSDELDALVNTCDSFFSSSDENGGKWLHCLQAAGQKRHVVVGPGQRQADLQRRET